MTSLKSISFCSLKRKLPIGGCRMQALIKHMKCYPENCGQLILGHFTFFSPFLIKWKSLIINVLKIHLKISLPHPPFPMLESTECTRYSRHFWLLTFSIVRGWAVCVSWFWGKSWLVFHGWEAVCGTWKNCYTTCLHSIVVFVPTICLLASLSLVFMATRIYEMSKIFLLNSLSYQ